MTDLLHRLRDVPDPDCPLCGPRSPFKIPGCLVLDVLQVEPARRRWQWADLDAGANDCPCIQMQRMAEAFADDGAGEDPFMDMPEAPASDALSLTPTSINGEEGT